jgi:hypothetical protein
MRKMYLMVVTVLLPMIVYADSVEIDGIYYNLINKIKEAEVLSRPAGDGPYFGDIIIPEIVTYEGVDYIVTSIGDNAFSTSYWGSDKDLISVSIPKSIKHIGESAFWGTQKLEKVNIVDLNAWIDIDFTNNYSNPLGSGDNTFLYLNGEKLSNIVIPDGVKTIRKYAFGYYRNLESVCFPESLSDIEHCAFGYTPLTSVQLPDSLKSIGDYAFFQTCLLSISIPKSVTYIGKNAFEYCKDLTTINVFSTTKTIQSNTFNGCKNLKEVFLSNSITTIEREAFSNCSSLESIHLCGNITSVEYMSFYNCKKLKTIVLGKKLKRLGEKIDGRYPYGMTFANCQELADVYIYADKSNNLPTCITQDIFNDSYINYATLHVASINYELYQAKEPWKEFGTITTVPKLVYYVDGEVYKTQEPIIGEEITPETNPTKEGYIFSGWSEIPETMPAHDIIITGTFTKDPLNGNCGDGVTYSFNKDTHTLFISMTGEGTGTMEIIDTYTAPWEEYKSDIYNVDIEAGVTSVAAYSFRDCNNLVSVKIPSTVTSIGQVAFARCEKLAAISLPDGIKEIPASLFDGCKSLKSIELPDGITSIGEFAFMDCINLESILIPNGVSVIGAAAFYNCSQLISINIPENLSVIAEVAFSKCSSLTSIEIPNNVIKIESGAFAGCSSLQSIKSFITEPYSIQKDVFDENVYRQATLYIPKGTEKLYSRFDGWREFLNIVEMEDPADGIANLQAKDIEVLQNDNSIIIFGVVEGTPINIYDVSGKIVGSATAATGNTNIPTSLKPSDIGIVKVGEKTIKVIMK